MTSLKNRPGAEDPEASKDLPMPGQSGRGGGGTATEVGSRDEEHSALGGDPEPTRVTKKDKIQPDTGTRSDHAGVRRPGSGERQAQYLDGEPAGRRGAPSQRHAGPRAEARSGERQFHSRQL